MPKMRGRKLILSNKDKDRQRPDHRDPNMPVLLKGPNGMVAVDPITATSIFAERIRQAEYAQNNGQPFINWRNDPTYNLRKR